jgi:fermentation-respiration switch protein FrsA (DUF1100 family)
VRFVEQLFAGEYEAASEQLDSTMSVQFTPAKMAEVMTGLSTQLGELKQKKGVRREDMGGYDIVLVTLEFETVLIDAKVVFNGQHQISGFFFVPAGSPKATPVPDYIDSTSFTEHDITFGEKGWELPGTLAVPKGEGPFPAVVLIHGSGPNDRDETVGPNKPFRDIGQGLASRGIVTLRYDKRTKVYPAKFTKILNYTVDDEVVDDARLAVEFLFAQESTEPDQIYLLGHSLGAMLAPCIAAGEPKIDGLIMLAAPARPLEVLYLEQMEYIESLSASDSASLARLETVREQVAFVQSDSLTLQTSPERLPMGSAPSYWLDLRAYNQVEVARSLEIPMAFFQGGRDYQVTMQDFGIWQEALADRSDVTFKAYPNLNHLFEIGEGKATPEEYMEPGIVSREVVEDIAAWIREQ